MKVTIEIKCDNAAFEDGNGGMRETAAILRRLSEKLTELGRHASRGVAFGMFDSNGNRVGVCTVSAD